MDARYPIRVAASRTGLSPHLIRIWERRYSAVSPYRTETNRRLYTGEDIYRLGLLQKATSAGLNISQIAELSNEDILALLPDDTVRKPMIGADPGSADLHEKAVEQALGAVRDLDAHNLEAVLFEALVQFGQIRMLEVVLSPLFVQIGQLWSEGDLRVAHEHLASNVARSFLVGLLGRAQSSSAAPVAVVYTPGGQHHEIGALMAALTASAKGWKPIFLGADLPVEDAADAVRHTGASAVVTSLVYPPDDPGVTSSLRQLRRLIGDDIRIIAGGPVSAHYREVLDEINAVRVSTLSSFAHELDKFRGIEASEESD